MAFEDHQSSPTEFVSLQAVKAIPDHQPTAPEQFGMREKAVEVLM
jgi:hypothetical protein